jgi:hypothetical protein
VADPDLEAYLAAERLVREAHARAEAAAGGEPPPPPPRAQSLADLAGLLDAARGALPPELARQLADALRELLVALRAILDYSIARLERPPPDEPEVEDIPIG